MIINITGLAYGSSSYGAQAPGCEGTIRICFPCFLNSSAAGKAASDKCMLPIRSNRSRLHVFFCFKTSQMTSIDSGGKRLDPALTDTRPGACFINRETNRAALIPPRFLLTFIWERATSAGNASSRIWKPSGPKPISSIFSSLTPAQMIIRYRQQIKWFTHR